MATLVIFILILGILVLVHEFGHFYSAKKLGIRVEEFGFGFPPKVFGRKFKGTLYSFNLLPIGGFVKIFGEHGEGENERESFISRPVWQRFLVIVSGVLMNIILAWLFFSVGSVLGVPAVNVDGEKGISGTAVTVVEVAAGSPAEKSGIRAGDILLEMSAADFRQKIDRAEDVQEFVGSRKGEEINIFLKRGDSNFDIKLIPRQSYPSGEGPLGIAMAPIGVRRVSWYLAPYEGAKSVYYAGAGTIFGLGALVADIFSSGKVPAGISGPVGIFSFVGEARTLGIRYLIQLVALLSVNLAVLNIMPFPALDGGRVLFLAAERIFQKRINPKIENTIHTAGFVFLIFLMVAITYHDIVKLF